MKPVFYSPECAVHTYQPSAAGSNAKHTTMKLSPGAGKILKFNQTLFIKMSVYRKPYHINSETRDTPTVAAHC